MQDTSCYTNGILSTISVSFPLLVYIYIYIYVAEGYVWNEVSNVYRKCIRNNIKLLQGRKFDKDMWLVGTIFSTNEFGNLCWFLS